MGERNRRPPETKAGKGFSGMDREKKYRNTGMKY